MSLIQQQEREQLINAVVKQLQQKAGNQEAEMLGEFTRQYFYRVRLADLAHLGIEQLAAITLSHWRFMQQPRLPGDIKLKVYNPHLQQDGWQSANTIIEVVMDDMPFIVDSLLMALQRLGYVSSLEIYLGGIRIVRDDKQQLIQVLPYDTPLLPGEQLEAPVHIEINRLTNSDELEQLHTALLKILHDVEDAVTAWHPMQDRVKQTLQDLDQTGLEIDATELLEAKSFLNWLMDGHFIFIGCRDYDMIDRGGQRFLQVVPDSGLGVLKHDKHCLPRTFTSLPEEAQRFVLSKQVLIISKTNTKSTIHRDDYTDYIGVKRFNSLGELVGERRFIGLYTSIVLKADPSAVPFLRHKFKQVMQLSKLRPNSHDYKVYAGILKTLPADDLLQAGVEELLNTVDNIFAIKMSDALKLFIRRDIYGRFFSCIVYVSNTRINDELRQKIQQILMRELSGLECTASSQFCKEKPHHEQLHFVIRVDDKNPQPYNPEKLQKILEDAAKTWLDGLYQQLIQHFSAPQAEALWQQYGNAFPAGYRDSYSAHTAIADIHSMEQLSEAHPIALNLYKPLEVDVGTLHFKLFQLHTPVVLSDALPVLEHMGLKALDERPHRLIRHDGSIVWLSDFGLAHNWGDNLDVAAARDLFQDAFLYIWKGEAENDGFNRLVLEILITWREAAMLRAYSRYMRQMGLAYSPSLIEATFVKYAPIARQLVDYFNFWFDPAKAHLPASEGDGLEQAVLANLDKITNLEEDKILRRMMQLMKATLRTNYYQTTDSGKYKHYIAFKFNSKEIPDLPLPLPQYEIFVYSPRFEGVHLRGAKVARGGIRWSDRREDFRTEILGLMKAQQVKNAVIVPAGAKGGFYPKCLPSDGTREAIMEEAIACYKDFIRGLLDITDNQVAGAIVTPAKTRRYDEDDPYLVVAADKGTASFSDIANSISAEYNFWLGDAFASGGSAGYDHKKMGITARGAWESVKRHFSELAIHPDEMPFTVVGIGDMSGDVFGNGMLLSHQIKLVAAFNHIHIFLDPNPDPELSYLERRRLFNLPRSSWADYDAKLISAGGGVYERSAKSIPISAEVKEVLGIEANHLEPNDLIQAMLKAEVDLLWNGGIGTYVKGSQEQHGNVGDKANDSIRINGNELRCKVIGEGGNLGFTQLGRIEYSFSGGLIYTDFIDNSAGVDCSDHEVNIKILLNHSVQSGELTIEQRNQLLADMTDEVAALVLRDNYDQTQAINLAVNQAQEEMDMYRLFMATHERSGRLDRTLGFLPDDKTMQARKAANQALTRPELAILQAFCKIYLKEKILRSDIPEMPYFGTALEAEFPQVLRQRWRQQMEQHPLKREIIATQLSNHLVNRMGIPFVHRISRDTGAPVAAIVRCFAIAQHMVNLDGLFKQIEALDHKIEPKIQTELLLRVNRLIRRTTRWFIRYRATLPNLEQSIERFAAKYRQLTEVLPNLLTGTEKERFESHLARFLAAGVPEHLACYVALSSALAVAMDILELAILQDLPLTKVASLYFMIGEQLGLSGLRQQLIDLEPKSHWDNLAKVSLRDDLDGQQRNLTASLINFMQECGQGAADAEDSYQQWLERHRSAIKRWQGVLAELSTSAHVEFIMYAVALRQLADFTRVSQMVKTTK